MVLMQAQAKAREQKGPEPNSHGYLEAVGIRG